MLKLENLIKDFARIRAVDTVNLHLKPGEIFALLGPSGSGKTTLVRLITGILQPTYGRIHIGGISLAERPRHAKFLTSFIPEQPFFYERLSGREFIEFLARLSQLSGDRLSAKVEELSIQFEIRHLLDDRIAGYPQSAKKKLMIVAALARETPLIVLDEPLAGLDNRAAAALKDHLRGRASTGAAIFWATHTPDSVQDLCGRVGVLKEGRLIADCLLMDMQGQEDDLEAVYQRLLNAPAPAAARS